MSHEQEKQEPESTPRSKIKSRRELDQGSDQAGTRVPTPSSILVYVGVVIFIFGYGLLIPGEPQLAFDQRLAITVFFRLMIIFLLINRSFIGWILAIVFESLQIVLVALLIEAPGGPKVWGMVFLHTAALALLLTGATRQHILSKREESLVQPPDEEESGDDGGRQRDATSSSSSS